MANPLNPHTMKSPAAIAREVNVAAGHTVLDKWSLLDSTLAEKQLNAFTGTNNFRGTGPLARGLTDPGWTPDQFAHACGLM